MAILVHPSFSAMQSTVSGHGVYSYLPKKDSSLGQNLCDADQFFVALGFIRKLDIWFMVNPVAVQPFDILKSS